MNRILFKEQSDTYILNPSDPRFEHVRGVLRMREGDSFDVGAVNGPVGKAHIETIGDHVMEVSVEWGEVPPLPPPVYLLVGMCRPATARKILITAPTLGVRGIVFAGTGRSDPAYANSGLWTSDEWRKRLTEGVEQAFDTFLPDVHVCGDLASAMDHVREKKCLSLMMDVYEGTRPLSGIKLDPCKPVCLAVGPERGWNTNDRQLLRNEGFQLVSLNDKVLRVETAVTVGLTLVLSGMGVY